MQIPDDTYAVSFTANEIELLLNSISYERAENSSLTEDYRQEMLELFRKLSTIIDED